TASIPDRYKPTWDTRTSNTQCAIQNYRPAGSRIFGNDYDSPELFSPKCPSERELAWKAKLELERIISQVKLEIVPCATSNYGRLCAEGSINGKPLAKHMIALGLGSPVRMLARRMSNQETMVPTMKRGRPYPLPPTKLQQTQYARDVRKLRDRR